VKTSEKLFINVDLFHQLFHDYHSFNYESKELTNSFDQISFFPQTLFEQTVSQYQQVLSNIEAQIADDLKEFFSECHTHAQVENGYHKKIIFLSRPGIRTRIQISDIPFFTNLYKKLSDFRQNEILNFEKSLTVNYLTSNNYTNSAAKIIQYSRGKAHLQKIQQTLRIFFNENWQESKECSSFVEIFNLASSDLERLIEIPTFDQEINEFIFRISEHKLIINFPNEVGEYLSTFRVFKEITPTASEHPQMRFLMQSHNFSIILNDILEAFVSLVTSSSPRLKDLVIEHTNVFMDLIEIAWNVKWNSPEINLVVGAFQESVSKLTERCNIAQTALDSIDSSFEAMKTSKDIKEHIESLLRHAQKILNGNFSNSTVLIANTRKNIESVLQQRVSESIDNIIIELGSNQAQQILSFKIFVSKNNLIESNPLIMMIHSQLNSIFTKRLTDIFSFYNEQLLFNFDSKFEKVFESIELLISHVSAIFDQWKKFEVLFSSAPSAIDHLSDTPKWIQHYNHLKDYVTWATSQKNVMFGPILVDITSVKKSLLLKLDEWKKHGVNEIKKRFNLKVESIKLELAKAKAALRDIPTKATEISTYLSNFKEGQKTIVESKAFTAELAEANKIAPIPSTEHLQKALGALISHYQQREKEIQHNKGALTNSVNIATDALQEQIVKLFNEWNNSKPSDGTLDPEKALEYIQNFLTDMSEYKTQWIQLEQARESLELTIIASVELNTIEDETKSLQEIWNAILPIYKKLQTLLETTMVSLNFVDFKSKLHSNLEKLESLDRSIYHTATLQGFQTKLEQIRQSLPLIEGLKSPSIHNRHWKQVVAHFKRKIEPENLTVRQLFDLDLVTNKDFFASLIKNAQGEYSLFQYLDGLENFWNNQELEFYEYKDKVFLIRGWDLIISTISDHLSFLTSMQSSSYYATFRDQAISWDKRLNQLQVVLDGLLSIQRRYTYLDGVFSATSLLAKAANSFRKAEREFLSILKKSTTNQNSNFTYLYRIYYS